MLVSFNEESQIYLVVVVVFYIQVGSLKGQNHVSRSYGQPLVVDLHFSDKCS